MGELQSLSPVDTGPGAERRASLADRAARAGCGALRISNSTEELLALMCISKAGREARTDASCSENTTLVAREQDIILAGAISDLGGQDATATSTASATNKLLESALRTNGRVVCRKS